MTFEYLDSRDKCKTVKINGFFLHSAYSPKKEAERFCDGIKCDFQPQSIVITEPGLSYALPYLRKKFPGKKIGAIGFCDEFDACRSDYDFYLAKDSLPNLQDALLAQFSETDIFSVLFLSWQPAERIFSEEHRLAFTEIKAALEKAKTLLVTRQFFEKKWLINCANFIKYTSDYRSLEKTDLPIVIAASGPSLNGCLPILKSIQARVLIIALSSALRVLTENKIRPDFCLSADGGYWAGEHLKILAKSQIPLALTCEGFCKKSILRSAAIIPLEYSDGISQKFCSLTEIPFERAERNGTVSGTALTLAMRLTSERIFFCGLDLSVQRGFQHAQPNEIEANSEIYDFALSTREKRLSKASFKNQSLEIYQDWFSAQKALENRIFRIIPAESKKNSLGKIRDLSPAEFSALAEGFAAEKSYSPKSQKAPSDNSRKIAVKKILAFIEANKASEEWKKSLFPLDYVALRHNPLNSECRKKLEKENSRLVGKLRKILEDE